MDVTARPQVSGSAPNLRAIAATVHEDVAKARLEPPDAAFAGVEAAPAAQTGPAEPARGGACEASVATPLR